MILWEAVLVTAVATVVVVNGWVPQQADLNTALVQEQENIGGLNIDQRPVPVQQNLDNGLVREENDLDISVITDSDDLDNTGLVQEQHDLDGEEIQNASDKGIVREQNDFGISTITDTDDLDNNLLEEQHDLEDAEISMDKTGLSRNPDKRSLFDLWESIIETNKSCTPTVSCSHADGHCFYSGSTCSGTVDAYGCIGGGRCMCCIPVTTSTIPTTTPNDPDTTAAPTTTPIVTTSTIITTTPNDTRTTAAPTTTPTELACPGGFMMMNQCFKIFDDTTRSWEDARSKCRSEYLILAEPSDSVAVPLREYVLKNYGTGDYQCWLGARGDGSKFVWRHSGKFLFNNNTLWDTGYLSSSYISTSYCLELDVLQSQWSHHPGKPYDSARCTTLRWTLCENTTSTNPTSTAATFTSSTSDTTTTILTTTVAASANTTSECPGGFLMMNQCFRIFNDTTRIWEDAQSKCRSENLILAEPSDSVATPLREYVLKNYGTGDYQCWLGARGDGSKFVWQHSGKSLFGNNSLWDSSGSLSSSSMSTSRCLELDALQGEWASDPGKPYDPSSCTISRWTLCEDITTTIPSTSAASTTTSQETTSSIPTTLAASSTTTTSGSTVSPNLNWLTVGADRFVKYNQTMSWTDARTVCRSVGLDLYQPRNILAISKYLDENHFNGRSNIQFWLGGHGNGTNQVWFSGIIVHRNAPWYGSYASSVGTNHCMLLFTYGGFADRGTVLGAYNCLDTTFMRPLCG